MYAVVQVNRCPAVCAGQSKLCWPCNQIYLEWHDRTYRYSSIRVLELMEGDLRSFAEKKPKFNEDPESACELLEMF